MEQSDESLLTLVTNGDVAALGILFQRYEPKLKKLVAKQLDPRLMRRIDVSDVIQEVHIELSKRIDEFTKERAVTLYHWMCFITKQKVAELARHHMLAQIRDVRREVPLQKSISGNSSLVLANHLISQVSSPSSVITKAEVVKLVNQAIDNLEPDGRDAIVMRHVDQLKTEQAAELLGISQATFRQRYFRALRQLRKILQDFDLSWGDL